MNVSRVSPTVSCPAIVNQGESKTFVGIATQGTPPYTVQFLCDGVVIAGPEIVDEGVAVTYVHTFDETFGMHIYSMEASDSNVVGAKSCTETCSIDIVGVYNIPTCSFTIS